MKNKPNAANITHGLAQLDGGSKKDGGDGMIKGVENVFTTGVKYGVQLGLNGDGGGNQPKGISASEIIKITKKKNDSVKK